MEPQKKRNKHKQKPQNIVQPLQSWAKRPDFKIYYSTLVIRIALYWNKNRPTNQHNTEILKVNPHICSQLTFDKGHRTQVGERMIVSINGAGNIRNPHEE